MRRYLTRRTKRTTQVEAPDRPHHGLLSLRSAVIFAIATTAGVTVGHWSDPAVGFGAWVAAVVGLDAIIDPDTLR